MIPGEIWLLVRLTSDSFQSSNSYKEVFAAKDNPDTLVFKELNLAN